MARSIDTLPPDFLGPRFWLDFRHDHLYDERLEDLLRELHDQPRFRKPPLGRPAFLKGLAEPVSQPAVGVGDGPDPEAGQFAMGSPSDEPERSEDEGPQHRVRLEGFWLGQTPVTQAQWRVVAKLVPPLGQRWLRELKAAPSCFQPEADKSASIGRFALLPGEASTDQRTVERVSGHDAIEFCRRLDTLLPTDSGLRCSLPSEAQWEYACRAESSTPFASGETLTPELANCAGSVSCANGPNGDDRRKTTPVGMFAANAWGLQDMHGNVWEWCLDHCHDSDRNAPFSGEAWLDAVPVNRQANEDRSRLLRGGSWYDGPGDCRLAWREILEYFARAAQLGLTATRKETKYIFKIEYFGEPIYRDRSGDIVIRQLGHSISCPSFALRCRGNRIGMPHLARLLKPVQGAGGWSTSPRASKRSKNTRWGSCTARRSARRLQQCGR